MGCVFYGSVSMSCSSYYFLILGAEPNLNNLSEFWGPPQQREKCKDWFMYPDCPKAVKLERLDKLVEDGNGDSIPLHELIADDKAVDLVARLDAGLILDGYPRRFVQLAYKQYAGYPLTSTEKSYYYKHQKKAQKSLV